MRRSSYEKMADELSETLRRRARERKPWPQALASARQLSRIFGMSPSIRNDAGCTIHEMSDGRLQICGAGEEVCVEEEDLEQVLLYRGLQDHLWHG